MVIPVEIVPGERISAAVTAHLHARRIIEIGQIISGRGSAFGTDPQYDKILFHRVIGAVQVPDLRIGEILSGPARRRGSRHPGDLLSCVLALGVPVRGRGQVHQGQGKPLPF